MIEGKRQKQVASVIGKYLNDIFQRLQLNMVMDGMVSISEVKMTPDLLECRIYLSLYKIEDKKAALELIRERAWEIKRELALDIKHQLRRVPVLSFFQDDSLDYAFHMEELFKSIEKEKKATPPATDDDEVKHA